MRDKVIFNDDSSGDAFTDLLFNALLGFAFMFFISFALIQKPLEDGNIESKAEFIISVEWDDYHPDDVDLIVEDPKGNVVYFQNKEVYEESYRYRRSSIQIAELELVNDKMVCDRNKYYP